MIAKGALAEGATAWAQGGIAAVLDEGDTFDEHVSDTMIAGAGLNDRAVVEHVVVERAGGDRPAGRARRAVQPATTDGWHLTREGGHQPPPHRPCRRRHRLGGAAGAGKRGGRQPQHHAAARQVAIDLITGRHADDFSASGAVQGSTPSTAQTEQVEALTARATILATGGAGRIYLYSTAPRGATGDGIAMAWRAGCRVSNMEFMQFHPTCLYNLEAKNFLITEAVRGEGGHAEQPRDRPSLHGRLRRARRARPARHRGARDRPSRSSATGSTMSTSTSATATPDFVRAHFPNIHEKAARARHRHHHAADPGRPGAALHLRRRDDRSATGGPTRRDSTPRARSPSRASTAPTGSRRTRCSNASCSARRRRGTSSAIWADLPAPPASAPGTKAA